MAQDVTARVQVLGQNPDGSLNVRMDGGNPFSTGGGGGAMQTMAQPGAVGQYRARIGNVEVAFATEADMLKAQMALSQMGGSTSGVPQLLGGTSGGGTSNWLGLAGNAASAVNNLFARSALDRKVKDYDRALAAQSVNREKLQALQSKYPDLVPVLQDLFGSERLATETAQSTLEDLVNAQGIAIGVDVTRVAADYVNNNNSGGGLFSGGSGAGTLLAGGAGLAVGLLASRSSSRDR
jgi:hypothetical protein